MIIFKRLQSTSEEFPHLSFFIVSTWAKQIGIVDETYDMERFQVMFGERKV